MQLKHSPAPWTVRRSRDAATLICIEPFIAWVDIRDSNSAVEGVSNARLIAAAPDLLEACKALLNCDLYFDRKQAPEVASKYQAAYQMARAAIAKAEVAA